jgi:hypothetical protein
MIKSREQRAESREQRAESREQLERGRVVQINIVNLSFG